MKTTTVRQPSPAYELKDELARFCLPAANRDPDRKLAWTNSICILFLLIGVLGVKPAVMPVQTVPAVEEIVPTIIEPAPPPPQTVEASQKENLTDQEKPEASQVVVVTPETPDVNFAVPTIGTLLVPNAIATAPPLNPLRPVAPIRSEPARLTNTGVGGERPQPPYPKIALEQAEQGTVTLTMSADDAGNIAAIAIKESSGFPVLDRGTLDYVKRHWTLPAGATNRLFETSITYKLQAD